MGYAIRSAALVFLLATALIAEAQDSKFVYVMISSEPGAPTPAQVAEGYDFSSGGPPPLQGLSVENPQEAFYLLPIRARGDFKAYLDANPSLPRARLERYVIVEYRASSSMNAVMNAFEADPYVEAATLPAVVDFALPAGHELGAPQPQIIAGAGGQYGRTSLNVDAAWTLERGHALIGLADSGLATMHPDLVAFSGGQYVGGNFLPLYALDLGDHPLRLETNVDEAEPSIIANATTDCDPDGNGIEIPDFAGHGTHVSGLIAANATNAGDTAGVCRHCGLAMMKISRAQCVAGGIIRPTLNFDSGTSAAIQILADVGVQVINVSFGGPLEPVDFCPANPDHPICLELEDARGRDIVIVGASGNARNRIQWPSRDPRVVAAGGHDATLAFWNEDPDPPPNNLNNCPFPGSDAECGSNFTTIIGERRQEAVGAARDEFSIVYPNFDWNPNIGCGDSAGGPLGDGLGECTGTSMSSPLVAGVVGLVRSANPLLNAGDPETAISFGVRDVVATTSAQAQLGQPWDQRVGYGRPDARLAVSVTLGAVVGGLPVRNRLTPLFALYSTGSTDFAYTPSPQSAVALIINQASAYAPSGALVAGYGAFPRNAGDPVMPAPRAPMYIFSTHNVPVGVTPNLVPMYWLDRPRNWPLGCQTGQAGCNSNNRDFLVATSTAELQTMVAEGYGFRGMFGYVYARCTPEPGCIPAGAEALYRQCNAAEDDCAVFLENERAAFELQGYTTAYPAGSTIIGYAYPNVDADSDGLVDGFERVVGTNPAAGDSDGDGLSDSAELPLAAVSTSDPCQGPNVTCTLVGLFADGFE